MKIFLNQPLNEDCTTASQIKGFQFVQSRSLKPTGSVVYNVTHISPFVTSGWPTCHMSEVLPNDGASLICSIGAVIDVLRAPIQYSASKSINNIIVGSFTKSWFP